MLTLTVLLTLLVCAGVAQRDETVVKGASGEAVVEATVAKIETSCLFSHNKLFLRRLAYVESTDGTDEDFSSGFSGGIWKIDEKKLKLTKNIKKSFLNSVEQIFNIDWLAVKWEDLQKPLYSGLAAYLYANYLETKLTKIPFDLEQQSNVWKQHFNVNSENKKFLTKAKEFEQSLCKGAASDVIFAVDGVWSITAMDFELMKKFINFFISEYNVGPDPLKQSRFSLIQFGDEVKQSFDFDDFDRIEDYKEAIDRIMSLKQGRQTDKALDYLATEAFKEENGARKFGVSRVAIILVSGKSKNKAKTIESAKKLQKENIKVFVVAVGPWVDKTELVHVADAPTCLHLTYLQSFQEFSHLKSSIVKRSCKAPIEISNEVTEMAVGSGERAQCRIKINEDGNTVEAQVDYDTSTIYFSKGILPNPSMFEYKVDIKSNGPSHLYIPSGVPLNAAFEQEHIYCYIESNNERNSQMNMSAETGMQDPCQLNVCYHGFLCERKPRFKHVCVLDAFDCDIKNPCKNTGPGRYYWPHQESTKYVQCGEWGQCKEVSCPPKTAWSQKLQTCVQAL